MWTISFMAVGRCPVRLKDGESRPAIELPGETGEPVASAHADAAKLVRLVRPGEALDRRRRTQIAGASNRADHARVVPSGRVAEEVDRDAEAGPQHRS